jgi:glycosyltransferase involved in cell wall biosynthesis
LSLFLDAVEMLRKQNILIEVGVFGEGSLGTNAARLDRLGAEVVNRWLTEAEIRAVLPRFHAMVVSHIEASQSGIVATALGYGMPVIATPVGGLIEQIANRQTGLLALHVAASALVDSIKELRDSPELYRTICQNISENREKRSIAWFVNECVDQVRKKLLINT